MANAPTAAAPTDSAAIAIGPRMLGPAKVTPVARTGCISTERLRRRAMGAMVRLRPLDLPAGTRQEPKLPAPARRLGRAPCRDRTTVMVAAVHDSGQMARSNRGVTRHNVRIAATVSPLTALVQRIDRESLAEQMFSRFRDEIPGYERLPDSAVRTEVVE